MERYTIEDLRNGKVAVKNDGSLEELRKVAEFARFGFSQYYYVLGDRRCISDTPPKNLPTQSVKDFFK